MPKKSDPNGKKLKRSVKQRELRKRFLLICGGEKTEINYFMAFPKQFHIAIKPIAYPKAPRQIVERAIREKSEENYYQVWCVLDKDDFTNDDFNSAIRLAEQNRIKVAYSNEAFELWYLLHFIYCDTALNREGYNERLTQYLEIPYEKNDPLVFEKLEKRQEQAIGRAKQLYESYSVINPAQNNPCTTAYQLVEALRITKKKD